MKDEADNLDMDWGASWLGILIWSVFLLFLYGGFISSLTLLDTILPEHKLFYLLGLMWATVSIFKVIGYPTIYMKSKPEQIELKPLK